MKAYIVVDIGNSRIKWGRCRDDRVMEMVSLSPDQPLSWEEQLKLWNLVSPCSWAIAGVHPEREHQHVEWIRHRGHKILLLQDKTRLPIKIDVPIPYQVGIDRLLNAVAGKNRVQRETSIFIVDAGSAVTVDWIDESGTFRGGAIFPGIQMMARALHEQTAALPLIRMYNVSKCWNPVLPGTSTSSAIAAGVYWTVAGGIKALIRQMSGRADAFRHRLIFLTGGDAMSLAPVLDAKYELWPTMTLEGIRIAAEALP